MKMNNKDKIQFPDKYLKMYFFLELFLVYTSVWPPKKAHIVPPGNCVKM